MSIFIGLSARNQLCLFPAGKPGELGKAENLSSSGKSELIITAKVLVGCGKMFPWWACEYLENFRSGSVPTSLEFPEKWDPKNRLRIGPCVLFFSLNHLLSH